MAGLGRARFALISPRTLLFLTLAIGASVALALDQPDQLVTGKKLLIKTDANDTSKNKLVFVSKDTSFDLPSLSTDPTVNGAMLQVKDLGGSAGSITLSLPASRWSTSAAAAARRIRPTATASTPAPPAPKTHRGPSSSAARRPGPVTISTAIKRRANRPSTKTNAVTRPRVTTMSAATSASAAGRAI